MYPVLWAIFAFLLIISAIAVVSRKNPVYSALWLMLFFASMSGIYVFLKAAFLAATQLFIYIGAIIVLYLFVIMMLDFKKIKDKKYTPFVSRGKGIIFSLLLFSFLSIPIYKGSHLLVRSKRDASFGSTKWMAKELYLNYPFPIELASVLLIVALVGAFALTRKKESMKESVKES